MKKYLFLLILKSFIVVSQTNTSYKKPGILLEKHLIETKVHDGKTKYFNKSSSENLSSESIYVIKVDYRNTKTDKINTFIRTGIKEIGFFKNGFKNKLWKTTYKNKLVKSENWNDGLIKGKYRVYSTKGEVLYITNFGISGSGKYKDFYYKTGILKQEGNYENGKKQGEWCYYNEKGQLIKTTKYINGNAVSQ